jgi:thiol-disulfide isomerase/thioredoxin
MPLPVITKINDRLHFAQLLQSNPGIFIIKFGAEWCMPCKAIEHDVINYFNHMPDNVQGAIIDVDESFDVYAFLKSKKMVGGIPAILAYYKGNVNYIPNDSHVGSDKNHLKTFFETCFMKASQS